jgi:hypothetical protein
MRPAEPRARVSVLSTIPDIVELSTALEEKEFC